MDTTYVRTSAWYTKHMANARKQKDQQKDTNPLLHAKQLIADKKQSFDGSKDIFGIVSIILAFTIFQVVGIVFAIIGLTKSKKQAAAANLSVIGLVLNTIMLIFIFIVTLTFISISSYEKVIEKARLQDVSRRNSAQLMISVANAEKQRTGRFPQNCTELTSAPSASLNELFAPTSNITGKNLCSATAPSESNDIFQYKVIPTGGFEVSYWSSEKQSVQTLLSN